MKRSRMFFAIVLAASAALAQSKSNETWSVMHIAGSRVGYGREWSELRKQDGRDVRITEVEDVVTFTRFKQTIRMRGVIHVEETPDGALLSFRYDMQNPPAAPTRMSGRVAGKKLLIEHETDGQTRTSEKPWDSTCLGPTAPERLLIDQPLKPGATRTFKMFDLLSGDVLTVKQTAAKSLAAEPLLDEEPKTLLMVQTDLGPGLVIKSYVDAKGERWKESTSVLGLTKYRVPREEALKSITGAELDLATTLMVKVPKIENAHTSNRIVYRITIPAEDPSKLLPEAATQRVSKSDDDTAEVTVTSMVPPKIAPPPPPNLPAPDRQYLSANRFLQTDDERVQECAAQAVGEERDDWKQAVAMERWVSQNLKKKGFSTLFASAAEVARDLSGDCTEHAVLLAAMCRVRGISSRVAVGLVYSERHTAFVGHAWTEALIDRKWIPLDATLGKGRVGAGHIKFSDTSLAGDGAAFHEFLPLLTAMSKMRIEVVEVE